MNERPKRPILFAMRVGAASAAVMTLSATGGQGQPPPPPAPASTRDALQWVLPVVQAPRVLRRTFDSRAAMAKVSYFIYTPEVYDAQKDQRFPVLYWLHGSGGGLPGVPQLARHFDAAIRAGKVPPMLVVFANGLPQGMWCDSKDGKTPVETVVMKELLPHIDATFRTIATREGRLVEGFSMGGYGAARLGFKYHEVFGAVSILAGGPLDLEFRGPRATARPEERERLLKAVYGGDLEYFKANSPWVLAEQNAAALRDKTRVRLATGEQDSTFDLNRRLSEHLKQLNIPHTFKDLPGVDHNPTALLNALGESNWEFYRAVFGGKAVAAAEPPALRIENFQLTGERWTCTADGKPLSGILLKPEGAGPFPAVLLSHGLGGNAQGIMRSQGREFLKMGFLCIATDYTHARQGGASGAGRPRGSAARVDFSQAGARPENIRRARACVEILRSLPAVDGQRIAAFGHSMGGFVTIGLAATATKLLKAAAITGGGLAGEPDRAGPTVEAARKIRTPFLILHGSNDRTVRPEQSLRLKEALDANHVPNERHVFEGVGHNIHPQNPDEMYRLLRDWFIQQSVLPPTQEKPTKP
jgi:enterochelin esterase-like enzyme/dienelactone hydrolase